MENETAEKEEIEFNKEVSHFAGELQCKMLDAMNSLALLHLVTESEDFIYELASKDNSEMTGAMVRFQEIFNEAYEVLCEVMAEINRRV